MLIYVCEQFSYTRSKSPGDNMFEFIHLLEKLRIVLKG